MSSRVEIYLGPGFRRGEPGFIQANLKIGQAEKDALVPMGPATGEYCAERFGCDIAYGEFDDDDDRVEMLAEAVNRYQGLCAKVVAIFNNPKEKLVKE